MNSTARLAPDARLVLLSPHLDDAVWSLGGAVPAWRRDREVTIVTLCDGDAEPAVAARLTEPAHRWRAFGGVAARRDEDARAAAMLGCARIGLGHRDAALRASPDCEFECPAPDALFAAPGGAGAPTVPDALEARLRALLRPDDQVIAPLGFGGHVDHCIAHLLARRLPHTVAYYAEFPYYAPAHAATLAEQVRALGLAAMPVALECDWPAWVDASLCYRSQVIRLFGGRARFIDALSAYAGDTPRCLIWSTR
ncbi:PIG-L deacetylase family protein [Burkholderia ubonensis]|uniref:GlcNAc-PI de-N-acetylase n=1 Tax=Burkholderia ubonensis TaxID=101571 RepID=A0A118N1D3_9BURK|nr:PIG-L family deacetylase [Burkholderia ubonensis]AOK63859.1 hypothetical protein WM29_32035 [Burkholderia ubonensis]KVM15238.1 hypothetical protein WJ51_12245 [Burkholderia ubonensis]KVM20486.1 hypothetical protein WJ52_05380 [Burkholderia ubonensis]KVM45855.1 hypothetical protein WJ56_24390 [Burkholderia ubonensis]KVN74903.1 hypothetical protein WJ68_27680 [Burkholderia ubonensis]